MSGRRRQSLSPSLFPFLAVLVCTLGTLILLLALVAQNATETAEQNARAQKRVAQAKLQAAEAVPDPPRMTAKAVDSMISEHRFRFDQLVAFRDEQTADLEQRRDQLTHLEDHLDRLRKKLKRLSNEVDNAMGETRFDQIDDESVANLRASIDAERAVVEKLRGDSANKTPRIVIVPHKGPNGTDRRPVYLECDAQGVTIWPEGSRITVAELDNSTHSANPLDAALRAVRFHVTQNYGDTTPPYPLLVVRPDGIETYGAARKAMLDWDDQFGYELVPADVKLAFTKPDANLKQRVEIAIREAAAKQYASNLIAQRASTGRGTNGRGALGRGAGASMDRSSRPTPILSAASLDRSGRASGFRSAADDYRAGSPQFGRSPYTSSLPSTAGSRYGAQTSDNLSGGAYGGGPYGGGAYGANMDPSASTRELANQMQTAAREMREQQSAGTADTANDRATAFDQNGQNRNGSADHEANPSEGTSQAKANDDSNVAAGQPAGSQTKTQSRGSSAQASSQQAPSSQTTASGQRSSGSQPSAPTTSQSGSNSASTDQQQTSAPSPQISFDASPQRELVQRQGRDWALPPHMAGIGGNSIVRTIRVQCYADRLVLLPPSTGGATEMFGFSDGNLDRASLELASAVRDRVDRWGPALPGGRWQPRLDVQVASGGESRFHQLKSLMSGSGVEVTGRASQ